MKATGKCGWGVPPQTVAGASRSGSFLKSLKPRLHRLLILVGFLLAILWCLLPRPEIVPPNTTWSRTVRDRHGTLLHLSTAADGRYRLQTPLAGVSPQWIEATLAKEDRWFRWHPGVNPLALLRAAWGSVTGHPAGGASTLTMQVARLRWGLETRTVSGKLFQVFRATQGASPRRRAVYQSCWSDRIRCETPPWPRHSRLFHPDTTPPSPTPALTPPAP